MRGIGKAVAAAAATAAAGVAVAVGAGIKGAIDIERGLAEVVTLTGQTGEAAASTLAELTEGVGALSDQIGIAQTELTAGLYDAISAGVPKDNAFEFMEVAGKAAIAGVTDVGTAVDGLSTTLNAFGLEADQAGAVADSMFTAVKGGKTNFQELSDALFNVAPAAAAAGVGFDEVNAAIATLTAGGTPTSVATTQIRAALVGLQRPSEDLDKIFQELGHDNAEVAIQSEGLAFALDAVKAASGGSQGELQKLLGSTEAVAAANVLAGTGAEKFRAELDAQAGAAGATEDAFGVMNETVGRQFDQLKTQVSNVAIGIGQELLPVANEVVAWAIEELPPAIETVRAAFDTVVAAVITAVEWFDRFKVPIMAVTGVLLASYIPALVNAAVATVVQTGRKIAAWTAMRIAGLKSIASVVAGFASMVASGAAAAAAMVAQAARQVAAWVVLGAQSLLQAAKVAAAWLIAMGPIGLVIAAVVGLVALIIKNWDTIVEWTRKAWTWVSDKVAGAWNAIVTFVSEGVGKVVTFARELPGRLLDGIKGLATTVLNFIVRYHPAAILARKGAELLPGFIGFIREIPGKILDALGNLHRLMLNAGKNLIQGLIDGIKAKIQAVRDTISNVASAIRDRLPFSPAKVGPLSGTGSPDRAGVRIAEMMAEGLQRGRSQVEDAMASLAGALAAPQPAAVGPAVPARNVNIQVNSNDPMATAAELSREMAWQTLGGF